MHRSGTSALTRCINLLGLSLGEGRERETSSSPDNPRGFWEAFRLTQINESILEVFNGAWLSPPYLEGAWWKDHRVISLHKQAQALLAETFVGSQYCWKDPRNCLTLPFWLEHFSDRPIIVFIRRNPLEIAKSLERRNGLAKSAALALWSVYIHSALMNIASLPVFMLDFDSLLGDPLKCLSRIKAFLDRHGLEGLETPQPLTVREFLTTDLLHWRRRNRDFLGDVEVRPEQKQLFEALRSVPEATDEFEVPSLPAASFALHEVLALHRDRTPSPQAELQKAQTLQADTEQQLTTARTQQAAREIQITQTQAELRQLQQQVTELHDSVTDRDRRISELQAVEQRLTTSEGTLQVELQQLQQRVTEQADSLANRDQRIGELQAVGQQLTASEDALRTDLHQLEQRVTELDDSVADRDRRISELQAVEKRLTTSEGTLQVELQHLQQRVTEQADSLANRDQRIGELQAVGQQLTASEDALRTDLHQLEQRVTELDDSVADRDRRISELQAVEKRLTASEGALRSELQRIQQHVAELDDSLAGRDQRIGELEIGDTVHHRTIRERQEELNGLRGSLAGLRDERDAAFREKQEQREIAVERIATSSNLDLRLRALQRDHDALVRVETSLRQEFERFRSHRTGPLSWTTDLLWSSARATSRVMPRGGRTRNRLKDVFYAAFGRVFPESERYRQYLEWREVCQRRAAVSGASAFDFRQSGDPALRPYDVFIFPVIDWHYRHQRPQHIALELASRAHRVFYFSTTFVKDHHTYQPEPEFVAPNVCVVSLPCRGRHPVIYKDLPTEDQLDTIEFGLQQLRNEYDIGSLVSVVDHPFWQPLVDRLNNNRIVYDCMDHHAGFSNNDSPILKLEERLLACADLVITASGRLSETVCGKVHRQVLVRNGTEYEHFAEKPPPGKLALANSRPIIGYYGAIAEWFDVEMVATAARALPHCDFVLVGSTFGADVSELESLSNVRLIGEVPYQELPKYLHAFDVCTIPFKITELTLCTNPVKVYEYLSAGKPVVAVRLPELSNMNGLVRIVDDHAGFVAQIKEALNDTSRPEIERRQAYARENTWKQRGDTLDTSLGSLFPKVSVIVLTYNGLQFTKACLDSLDKLTGYPDWELIVVDNGSTDGTPQFLRDYAKNKSHVRVILNKDNKGFAAGNNQGARVAAGEYLVFLNNDTYVTRGWMADLLAHFRRDRTLGVLNPVTNNIGNEARIDIDYKNMTEMAEGARRYTRAHRRRRRDLPAAAFFCVMIPTHIWNTVGELDEGFGIGFFEDDDYARRVHQLGYKVACAEDVFVHHHLSASFDKVSQSDRESLFANNRRYFESKWGPWDPHKYRGAVQGK